MRCAPSATRIRRFTASGFSSSKADAAHYADRELPIHWARAGSRSRTPTPARRMDAWAKILTQMRRRTRRSQAFDCLGLLAPPLALAKMAAIATADSLPRNVPELWPN